MSTIKLNKNMNQPFTIENAQTSNKFKKRTIRVTKLIIEIA